MLFLLHYYVAFIDLARQQTSSSGDSKCAHVHHYILNGTTGKGLVDDNNILLNEALIHLWRVNQKQSVDTEYVIERGCLKQIDYKTVIHKTC
jgi:hypothetical protein